MGLANLLLKIDALQQQIDAKGTLDEAVKKRIQYKFRLDWNYYSNAMEGNSLTRQETRSVMMNNITINGKPIRDVMEVKGHDNAVLKILKIGKGEMRLSEKRILEMHKAIIHEEDPEKAGQVGRWKTVPNFMQNYRGERFDFLAPELVAGAIHDLLNKTNAKIDALQQGKKENPAVIAFYFHLEYVKIHPFYDGNGRTARLLMNLLLISFGFPPVILNLENKDRYYSLLTDIQGYGGNPDLFYEFMSDLLIQSQELVLDAIDGKDIAEDDDLDKEIDLFKKQLVKKDKLVLRTNENVAKLYKSSIRPLFINLLNKLNQFDDLFDKKAVFNVFDFNSTHNRLDHDTFKDFDKFFDKIIHNSDLILKVNNGQYTDEEYDKFRTLELNNIKQVYSIALRINYQGFKNDGTNTFGKNLELYIYFNDYSYVISKHAQNQEDDEFVKKLYTEDLTQEEVSTIVKYCVGDFLSQIKSSIKKEK